MLHLKGSRAEQALPQVRNDLAGSSVETAIVTTSPDIQVEAVLRNIVQPLSVKTSFRETTVIWHLDGLDDCEVSIDGQFNMSARSGSLLMLVPARSEFGIRFPSGGLVRYTMIRFRSAPSIGLCAEAFRHPIFDITHPELLHAVETLCREAEEPDGLFDMLAESWVLQANVYFSRLAGAPVTAPSHHGGLAASDERRIMEFIHANFTGTIRIADLARLSGLGSRHLIRAFQQSFSTTPLKYVMALRMREGRRQLVETDASITEIAISCGFSHIQHFTTAFHKHVGTTPSRYRQTRRG